MKKNRITAAKEDYLLALYRLSVDGTNSVRIVDLADRMKLSKSTISERIKELAKHGLVHYKKYADIVLTVSGIEVSKKLLYRHRILEVFLHEVLHVPKEDVHREAHLLEHGCSDYLISKIAHLVNNPTTDPHGQPIQ